jgi:hypothetical protein
MHEWQRRPGISQSNGGSGPKPHIEDYVLMPHADCIGIVVGELGGGPLTCAECGKESRCRRIIQ